MITKAGIIYGLGDALNARAFLLTYCKQKGIEHKSIKIFTQYWDIFKDEGFIRETNRDKMKGLIGYRNFCNYDLPKKYDIKKCDECIAKNAEIDFSFDTIVPLNWNTPLNISLPRKFVTVNNGVGKYAGSNYIYIKQWLQKYWEDLVLKIGVPCVQIGSGDSCTPIKGCVLNLVNKTNIYQTAEVMKKALFHIDIEGALPILNQHIGKKSVVLFGATGIGDKGRSFNLNLCSDVCNPCYEWGTFRHTQLRVRKGMLDCDKKCMTELKPDYVIERIYQEKWL